MLKTVLRRNSALARILCAPFGKGVLSALRGSVSFVLRDDFSVDVAAGFVNGSVATDGKSARTVVDTEGKISVANGVLSFSGGKATPGSGDPSIWFPPVARAAGVVLLLKFKVTDTTKRVYLGFDTNASGSLAANSLIFLNGTFRFYRSGEITSVGAYEANVDYEIAIATRAVGSFFFIKGGAFTNWTLVYIDEADTAATLYPSFQNYDAVATVDYACIPESRFLPVPTISDGFSGTDGATLNARVSDGLGHAEGVAATYGSGGSGVVWTAATGSLVDSSGMKAKITPTQGEEVVTNGTFAADESWTKGTGWTIGSGKATKAAGTASTLTNTTGAHVANAWYAASYDLTVTAGGMYPIIGGTNGYLNTTSGTYTQVQRATNTNAAAFYADSTGAGTLDNFSIKPLDLSSLFATAPAGVADVMVRANVNVTTYTQAGVVVCMDDPANPANFIIGFHDGLYARLQKCVAGVYTSLVAASTTYVAGAEVRVVKSGSSVALYYNGVRVGAIQTVTDETLVSNTIHGLFSTHSANVFDNFAVYPVGTEGQYNFIDKFTKKS